MEFGKIYRLCPGKRIDIMDIKSAEERSRNMSAIKNKDTVPEIFFRKLLFARGFRYRKNVSYISGHPDLYLARYHTAIFIHGCFWHRHKGCKYAYLPKTRQDFWENKFQKNIIRDKEVLDQLIEKNTRCLIVWECSIKAMMKSKEFRNQIVREVIEFLDSERTYMEIGSQNF